MNSGNKITDKLQRWQVLALAAALLIVSAPLLVFWLEPLASDPLPVATVAESFVGSEKCRTCHESDYRAWYGSDHEKAMAKANEATVLGNFDNQVFVDPYTGLNSRFYRHDQNFYVETEGPDGKPGQFRIDYTFGVIPLQQYLVTFPSGRIQCLNIAWDVEKKQWYRLPPYDIKGADDWLHWTKGGQRWNAMCAECHSTRLSKNYDLKRDEYQTSWFEISVGCEACHGPGRKHVEWADTSAMGRRSIDNYGLLVKTDDLTPQKQIAICAPCHSRRFQLGDNLHNGRELLDLMVPQLLTEDAYYPDGQILGEVYVYGSFTQSKMYHRGVRCSDCHNAHSLKLHKTEGNVLCIQCHRGEDYDTPRHHFHKKVYQGKPSQGYLCISCHMPQTTYMGIDARADHSLRIPRPDLSGQIGTPNACSTAVCHADKSLDWVEDHYNKWYGEKRRSHYGPVIAAGRAGRPEAEADLIRLSEDGLLPVIVRATALSLLANYPSTTARATTARALEADDALLRYTAIRTLEYFDEATRLKKIAPKLYDPVKAVRAEAAYMLSVLPEDRLREEDSQAFHDALAEYRAEDEYMGDFQTGRFNLGNLASNLGEWQEAIDQYRKSIEIDKHFSPAKINLAMLYNQRGDNAAAENLLREVVREEPQSGEVHYSLALLLAEEKRYAEAEPFLATAADLLPGRSRVQLNHGLILQFLDQPDRAAAAFRRSLEIDPGDADAFNALAGYYLSKRQIGKLRSLIDAVLQRAPDNHGAKELLERLQQ